MTFRKKLFIALLVLLIPILTADIYYHYDQYKSRRAAAFATYSEAARDLARNTQLFVSRTVAIEHAVGMALDLPQWQSPAARQRYIRSVVGPKSLLTNIALADPTGRVITAYPDQVKSVNAVDRQFFQRILNGADWTVSDLLVGRLDNKPGFVIATAIRTGGKLKGVVLSRIEESRVRQLLLQLNVTHTTLVLTDAKGHIVFLSNQAAIPFKEQLHLGKYISNRSKNISFVENMSLPGERNLTGAILPVPSLGWSAGAFAPSGQVLQSVRQSTLSDTLIMFVIFGFTLVIGSLLAQQLTSSVNDLAQAAEHLGQGNFNTRVTPPRVTEFVTLANTMNTMAESIQQRDAALSQAYERERRIATAFQKSMLPRVPAQIGRIALATAYFPALKESELGGDFYDVMVLPDGQVGLLVADVSGKGLEAAVHTAMAKYTLKGFAYEDSDPARALRRLSAVMHDQAAGDKFITAFFAVVDPETGALKYANAGHPQPLLRHENGTLDWLLVASGPPLGVVRDPEYVTHELALKENEVIVCYTDGIIEARKEKQWFGSEGLKEVVRCAELSPDEIVHNIYITVSDFVGGQLPDDIALMAVKLT